jgi:hypothetical protein
VRKVAVMGIVPGSRARKCGGGGGGLMSDDRATEVVRKELEIARLSSELSEKYHLSPEMLEAGVRAEFDRRAAYPIQEFVPIFVERSVRGKLRRI